MAEKEEATQETSNYKVSGTSIKKVDDLMNKDKEDESLNKWKAALLGKALSEDISPKDDPRRVVICSMTILFEGHTETNYTFDTKEQLDKLKDNPFVMKEACHYRIRLRFKVQHELVTGLKHVNAIYRHGLKVAKEETMIGSFGPQVAPHEVIIPRVGWEEAPTGLLARGKYTANSKFIDDDGQTHLDYDYAFSIKKDWDAPDE